MIDLFIGEFLFHPAAMVIEGNTCSHNCCYCYANSRNKVYSYDFAQISNLFRKKKPTNLMGLLLELGYPICLSNKTDPFSKNNYIQTLALTDYLNLKKAPLYIQTKGGYGIPEFIEKIENTKILWFITITTPNEETKKRIEPNAPSIEERIRLAESLIKQGYEVIVGVNPLFEKWCNFEEFKQLTKMLKAVGVKNITIEPLHISSKDYKYLNNDRKARLGDNILNDIKLAEDDEHRYKCLYYLLDEGINTYTNEMPGRTDLYEIYRKTFGKSFFCSQDFVNYASDKYRSNNRNGVDLYFDEYLEVMKKGNEELFKYNFNEISRYIFKQCPMTIWRGKECQQINNFTDLFRFVWNTFEFYHSPRQFYIFHETKRKDNANNIILYADNTLTYTREEVI
jgi:DNA repair photolyase